jgi:hypothetical protein
MLDKLREGDFYILVPDNETKREVCGFRRLSPFPARPSSSTLGGMDMGRKNARMRC